MVSGIGELLLLVAVVSGEWCVIFFEWYMVVSVWCSSLLWLFVFLG